MSEEKVEKDFSNGLKAYSVSEQAAKAGPRRQIKTKEILVGHIGNKMFYELFDPGLQCHSTEYVFPGESGTLLSSSQGCSEEVRLSL